MGAMEEGHRRFEKVWEGTHILCCVWRDLRGVDVHSAASDEDSSPLAQQFMQAWLQSVIICNHDWNHVYHWWLLIRLYQGGGIYIQGGTVNIDTSQISSNTATNYVSAFSNLLKPSMAFFHDPAGWLQLCDCNYDYWNSCMLESWVALALFGRMWADGTQFKPSMSFSHGPHDWLYILPWMIAIMIDEMIACRGRNSN